MTDSTSLTKINKDLLSEEKSNWLEDIKQLSSSMPLRHSRYQLENFVVCQRDWPPDIQYKQCIRELEARYNVIQEHQFEFRDLCLQADSFSQEKDEIKSEIDNLENTESKHYRVAKNKFLRLENQIQKLMFRADVIRRDVVDLLREMEILSDLEKKLAPLRKHGEFEKAEEDYWSKKKS